MDRTTVSGTVGAGSIPAGGATSQNIVPLRSSALRLCGNSGTMFLFREECVCGSRNRDVIRLLGCGNSGTMFLFREECVCGSRNRDVIRLLGCGTCRAKGIRFIGVRKTQDICYLLTAVRRT